MNPVVHAELSWLMAQPLRQRRDRILVTCAGLAPDLDGLSMIAGSQAYSRYHHVLTHGFVAALAVTALLTSFSRKRLAVAALALAAFHLHLVCDLLGSGVDWPFQYAWPFSSRETGWSGSWPLNSWQNVVIGIGVTLLCLATALRFRRTIFEVVSPRFDSAVTATLRKRLGASP